MARNEARRSGVRRALGAAAVVACAGLVAIPLASPFLYQGVEDSRRELEVLLGRARSVRRNEAVRTARIRELLDERLRETRWAREDALGSLEEAAERLLARSPAAGSPQEIETSPPAPVPDDVVRARIEDLTRTVGLSAGERERLEEVCVEYRVRADATLQEERVHPSGRGAERMGELRDEAMRRIEAILLPEQRLADERMRRKYEILRKAGVVVPPLPGAHVARSGHR